MTAAAEVATKRPPASGEKAAMGSLPSCASAPPTWVALGLETDNPLI